MVYLGSALMVFNIYGFIRFALRESGGKMFERGNRVLVVPIVLLVMFLLGYLVVGIFGKPDIIVSGILFGGSIFVFVMYRLLGGITKKILETEQLKAKLMATEEASRAKTEFLSGVSHEMRTPMNVIIGLDTMALKDEGVPAETRDRLQKIGSSAKHLLGLINNILDMNSLESGEFVLKNEEFSLCDAVGQINAIAGALCDEKGLTYDYVSDDVGGSYVGDDMRLKQILINLIDNAVKYTDAPGKVGLAVRDAGGGALRFEVSDTGIGIGADFLPKVFDVFSKEDAGKTSSHGGSGVGLALTKRIVDRLGGTIDVKSEKGVGSTFSVTLPLGRVENSGGDGEDGITLDGRRVLIVEDIPENAEIVADLLELEGVASDHAENGKVAVDMFSSSDPGHYDAILMDLRMPVMDGLTATREIRALGRADAVTVPIIALSANAFESDIKESIAAGMDAHLSKPADSDLLYSTLKKQIERHEKGVSKK